MSWLNLRIGLFSDLHYSVDSRPEEHKWFPTIYNLLAKFSQKWADGFLRFWDRLTQYWANAVLQKLSREQVDFFVSLGDVTPGINEEGMKEEKAVDQARQARGLITWCLGQNKPIYFIPGGHDIGYFCKLPGGQEKFPSDISCKNYESIFGATWQIGIVKDIRLIFLYSYLLCRPASDFSAHPYLAQLKARQERWLKHKLGEAGEPIILFLHDPWTLLRIYPLLEPHRHKIICTVVGHIHSRFIFRLLKLYHSEWRELKVQMVPAPWGWCGIGRKGGGAIIEVESDGQYRFKII